MTGLWTGASQGDGIHKETSAMIVQLVVASGNRTGKIIPIPVGKFIIGRAEDCHLKPRSELISRYHCAILVGDGVVGDEVIGNSTTGNNVIVRDLGSRNGVRLNGEKISAEQKLKNGDRLVIGPLEFYVYIADGDAPAALPTEAYADTQGSWISQPNDSESPSESAVTVLLDHLKSLNPEEKIEPEQPVLDLLKKFL